MDFKKVMIPIDESPLSIIGLERGLALAAKLSAEVALVHVVDSRIITAETGFPAAKLLEELRKSGRSLLDRALAKATSGKAVPWTFIREGVPAKEIVAAANEWGTDVIVIATHGRSGVSRFFMGSTAEEVLRHATCPVLTVKFQPDYS